MTKNTCTCNMPLALHYEGGMCKTGGGHIPVSMHEHRAIIDAHKVERELAELELRKRGLVGFVPAGKDEFGKTYEYAPEKMLADILKLKREQDA